MNCGFISVPFARVRRTAVPRKRSRSSVASVGIRASSWTGNSCRSIFRGSAVVAPSHVRLPPAVRTITPSASLVGSLASGSAGVVLLGFIIFVHETGHFLAARLQNIKVENFSIGFGPTLVEYSPQNSDTLFTLRALPLGGYVSFPEHVTYDEETEEETVNDDPDLLQNRPLLDRAIVISAGVVANIVLAWAALFTSVSSVGVPMYNFSPGVIIADLVDSSGAGAKAGAKPGDIILKVDGETVPQVLDSAGIVANKIRTSQGNPIVFQIDRSGQILDLKVRPKCCSPEGDSVMGVQLVPNAEVSRVRPSSPLQVIRTTNQEFSRLSYQTWKGLVAIVSNFKQSSKNLAGPIGVVSMGADLARNDTAALFTFCAVISINLALINSLPLPALDGGQMVFLIIEGLRGAPLSLRFQDAVNRTALLLFLAFSGVLFFGDLEKLKIVSAIQKLFG